LLQAVVEVAKQLRLCVRVGDWKATIAHPLISDFELSHFDEFLVDKEFLMLLTYEKMHYL
jgi:hypothetical protein